MSRIIDTEQMKKVNFNGASIYLDACFIVTFFDKSDHRQSDVIEALATWSECDEVKLAISNHTVSECINTFFHLDILSTIETYHKYNHIINQRKNGYNSLSQEIKDRIGNLDSARFIHRVAKESGLIETYNNRKASAKINDLIKAVKQDYPQKRELIDVYYANAVSRFNNFLQKIEGNLGFQIQICSSGEEENYLALSHIRLFQLEPSDAFHLAVTRLQCDYLATLDSDFANGNYSNDQDFTTPILKIS